LKTASLRDHPPNLKQYFSDGLELVPRQPQVENRVRYDNLAVLQGRESRLEFQLVCG
jgi:hypothetical protein